MKTATEQIIEQFRKKERERTDALAEVLCSAYKDATGRYPDDSLRGRIFDALGY